MGIWLHALILRQGKHPTLLTVISASTPVTSFLPQTKYPCTNSTLTAGGDGEGLGDYRFGSSWGVYGTETPA